MKLDEEWLRAHLPEDCRNEPIKCFGGEYLDGLTVMAEGERGGPDTVVYRAKDEEDLRWWQLEQICGFIGATDETRVWRYERLYAKNGKWMYREHRAYDYNAIEDFRLPGFERTLRNMRAHFPRERWEKKVRELVHLMNYWYTVPHWDYDREQLRFVEISDSKEHDSHADPVEEPQPGSIVEVVE